jgi:hypothetical protein
MYKSVRLDRTSHYDQKTKWRVGAKVLVHQAVKGDPCGVGIHCSPTLLHAVSYQVGPSRYYEVEPLGECLGSDKTKSRYQGVKVVREIGQAEQDELAGFKLYEANHPVNPLLLKTKKLPTAELDRLVREWASVGNSVGGSVWASVGGSVWAYIGGLFTGIKSWKYAGSLGPDPWRPLLTLWYAGYVPSYDGTTWRLHAGAKAKVVYEIK